MALGYLQRENLILESYWLVHKEKACVASRKHLKRRSKEKFWKIDSGFYKISCKPPRKWGFYQEILHSTRQHCNDKFWLAVKKLSVHIHANLLETFVFLYTFWHHQHYAVFRNNGKFWFPDTDEKLRDWPMRSGFRFRIKLLSFIVLRGWKWLESHGIHGSFIWWNLLQN